MQKPSLATDQRTDVRVVQSMRPLAGQRKPGCYHEPKARLAVEVRRRERFADKVDQTGRLDLVDDLLLGRITEEVDLLQAQDVQLIGEQCRRDRSRVG